MALVWRIILADPSFKITKSETTSSISRCSWVVERMLVVMIISIKD